MAHRPETIEIVKEEISAGITSPDIISIRTGIPVDHVEEIVREFQKVVKDAKSNVDVMRGNLKLLQDLLDTAEWEYKGTPTVDNASAIVQMIQTSLSTIKEIESRKDPAVILNEILGRALQPLLRDFIKYATSEASRARDELSENIPNEHHGKIDAALKSLVKGMGRSLKTDYDRSLEILAGVLGCKPQDGKVRPMLKAVSEVPDGQAKESTSDS